MKRSLPVALSGLALAVLLLMGLVSGAAAAAPLAIDSSLRQPPADPQRISSLQSAVDQYLHSLPADYHTLKTVPALKSLMASGNTLLIDVRQPSEYRAGHIIGAVNIPLRELDDHFSDIPSDQEVVLYCSTGFRSAMGVMALQLQGFKHVRGFPPSLAGWQAAGEAVSGPEASGGAQA